MCRCHEPAVGIASQKRRRQPRCRVGGGEGERPAVVRFRLLARARERGDNERNYVVIMFDTLIMHRGCTAGGDAI